MAFKMKNPSVAKMAKMAGDNRSAAKFNAGLRKASAEGKLDNNPKFKDAVDSAPMKLKKQAAMKKGHKTPEEKAERKEKRARIRAKNKRRHQEYIESGDRKRDLKALPQALAKAYVKDMPKAILEDVRDAATSTKELVQKGVKAVGKGAKKVVSKVKNRKKKNK
jgi:hypothetical protein